MPKKNQVTDLKIDEVSLVDDPANEGAKVVIVKSKARPEESPEVLMLQVATALVAAMEALSPEIIEKAMAEGFPADEGAESTVAVMLKETIMDMEAIAKALEAANEKNETLAAALTKANADLADRTEELAKAKDKGQPEPSDEELLKALPESIRKRLSDAEAASKAATEALEKSAADAERATALEKAKALNVGDVDKVADLLVRVAKGKTTAEDANVLETVLKSASALAKGSDLFKSFGSAKDGEAETDPEAILKAKAEEIRTTPAGAALTFAQAYDQAMSANPEVYNAYLAKRRGAGK